MSMIEAMLIGYISCTPKFHARAHQLTNVTKIDLEKSMYIHSIVLHLHLKS